MNENKATDTCKIPVFLLKTKSIPKDGYEEKFQEVSANGGRFDPVFVPVLEHKFLTAGVTTARNILRNKEIGKQGSEKYGGLIFTSQRAVELFAELVEEGRNSNEDWPLLEGVPIYTVGPATARALKSITCNPPLNIFGEESGNGEALAHYILEHYGKWHEGNKVRRSLLFMVGEQRRDIIPNTLMDPELALDKRIDVDELVVYGTGVMESFEKDFVELLRDSKDSNLRWMVVFSPTGCEAMLRALGMLDSETGKAKQITDTADRQRKVFIATIGPTTRDYLKKTFGYEPDVCAEQPSPEGVFRGIKTFLEARS